MRTFEGFMRGVNLGGWLSQADETTTEHYNEMTDKTYYACIILDATACCAQGMEFALANGFPGEKPKEGDMICVAGVYDRYEEDGFPYYTLNHAVFVEG